VLRVAIAAAVRLKSGDISYFAIAAAGAARLSAQVDLTGFKTHSHSSRGAMMTTLSRFLIVGNLLSRMGLYTISLAAEDSLAGASG